MIDTAGKRWNTLVANSAMSARPITNSGIDASTRCRNDETSSRMPSRRTAASEPISSESGIEMAAATSTRKAELLNRGVRSFMIGCPDVSELPGSPRNNPPTKCRYWCNAELVEAELFLQRRERCLRRLLAELGLGRVARQQLRGREHDDRHDDEGEQGERHAHDDETAETARPQPPRQPQAETLFRHARAQTRYTSAKCRP